MVAVVVLAGLAWALAYSRVQVRFRLPRVVHERRRTIDLGAYLAEVSARLRAGASEESAWSLTAERHGLDPAVDDGCPRALAVLDSQAPEAALGARAAALLAHELGAPLADLIDYYADVLAQAQGASDATKVAMAGPRTSARLLAGLPAFGILLGAVMGSDPIGAVRGGGVAGASACAGVVMIGAGYWWTRAMIARASRSGRLSEAIECHLIAGALMTGSSIPRALGAVGRASGNSELRDAGELLSLGAPWDEAWKDSAMAMRALEPAWCDGANPVPLLTGAARSVVARADRIARESAEKLAVRLVLPVGLCFLPAFVLIGVVPVVVSLGIGVV